MMNYLRIGVPIAAALALVVASPAAGQHEHGASSGEALWKVEF